MTAREAPEDGAVVDGVKGCWGTGPWGRISEENSGPGHRPPPHPTPSLCHLSRVGGGAGRDVQETRPRGKAGAPWVYSGGFQIPPRAWRGPRGTGQHTQSPRHAPHWLAVTSPLCQHRGVDSFPPGFMERDLTRPGLHPTPHTRPHTGPLFWGLGAKAPQGIPALPSPAPTPRA